MTGLLDRPDTTDSDGDGGGGTVIDLSTLDLAGVPVVTLGGDDVAGIDEPIAQDDGVVGFTLQKRSLFGGPLGATLPIDNVLAIGPDAVIVADEAAFVRDVTDEDDDEPLTPSLRTGDAGDGADAEPAASPALFSEVRKRDVVAPDCDEPVGRVDRFVIDPVTRTVGSIRLDKVSSDVRFLSWREITSFGEDVVEITSVEVLRKPDGPREDGCRKDFRASGKPVLTDTGHQIGEVEDVEFDREDGRITALITDEGRIDGHRLRGVGPHAVVVGG